MSTPTTSRHSERDTSKIRRPLASAGTAILNHRATLAWLLPVLAIAAAVSFINMAGSPQRIDDEGTYTAQAWAVNTLGELAHYTFWYDHPPVGWLQIAGYTQLTGAFARYDLAVLAAREAVLVATLISVVLVWLLARRFGMTRPAAAAAGLVFALSPLALQFHRTVYLDNVAMPWLLGAFLLAMSRRWQLAGFAGSAAAFGIAVLSKETFLLALPFLIWVMVRSAQKATRRYTLSVASSVLVLIGGSYLLLAAVKGELIPRENRVSLLDGILFQLSSRVSSGTVFEPDSLINRTFAMWWQLDPVIITLGVAASVIGLFVRRYRPIAAMVVALTLFMFRPGGYLPVPYIIVLLPFAALLIAGLTDISIAALRQRTARLHQVSWVLVATLATVAAAPLWTTQLRGFLLADLDAPVRNAQNWVIDNVSQDSRLIVDDAMWVDLVRAGWDRDNVLWYYKIDTDTAVQAQSPNGWRDSDFIITTDSMRTFPDSFPEVQNALENSVVVAEFGEGVQAVEVRQIQQDGIEASDARDVASEANRIAAGEQLSANPALQLSAPDRDLLTGGRVDLRIELALGTQLASGAISVTGFPLLAGEDEQTRRQVNIAELNGEPAVVNGELSATAQQFVAGLGGQYAPQEAAAVEGALRITFPATSAINLAG